MSISTIIVQIVITLVVLAAYHAWVSGKKQPAPPSSAAPVVVPPAAPAVPVAPVVQAAPVAAMAPVTPQPKPAPVVEAATPEMLAVIAAAIAVVLGRPHRVVSVEQAFAPQVNVWALEGRVEQFLSHKIR